MTEHHRWIEQDETVTVHLHVNGHVLVVEVPPRRTLADALRERGLTGTHLGCEHGVCGACTVLIDGLPVRSCLMLAVQGEDAEVETVEGDTPQLRALRRAFDKGCALQCGFCTPGFLMVASGLLRNEPKASPERVSEVLSSNLCRCTGGVPIVAAVLAAQRELAEGAQ